MSYNVLFQMNPYDLRRKAKTDANENIRKISTLPSAFKKTLINQFDQEEEELIKKQLKEMKLTQTPKHFFDEKHGCKNVHFFEYMNESLGIIVLGMQQPEMDTIESCIHMIVQYNVKVYITFNEKMPQHYDKFLKEKAEFKKDCKIKDCEFYSIPIIDYAPPTVDQLKTLWLILDRYHVYRAEGNPVNLLMHCTGGTGRTATMLMSYIWYKIFMILKKPTEQLFAQVNELQAAGVSNDDLLLFLLQSNIVQFLMEEINKYSPHAKKEVFLDAIPFSALPTYMHDENELQTTIQLYQTYPEYMVQSQRGNCILLLTRLKTIMEACINYEDGIINPLLTRLSGGIIRSSNRITSKYFKKRVQSKLKPKTKHSSESEEEVEHVPTWTEWFGNLFE